MILLSWDIQRISSNCGGGGYDYDGIYSHENMSSVESEARCYLNKTYEEVFRNRISASLWISLGFCDEIGYIYACDNVKSKEYYKQLFIMLDDSCEFVLKYEKKYDKQWSIKPRLSRRWKQVYQAREESVINYKDEVMFSKEHFENRGYEEYMKKKTVM